MTSSTRSPAGSAQATVLPEPEGAPARRTHGDRSPGRAGLSRRRSWNSGRLGLVGVLTRPPSGASQGHGGLAQFGLGAPRRSGPGLGGVRPGRWRCPASHRCGWTSPAGARAPTSATPRADPTTSTASPRWVRSSTRSGARDTTPSSWPGSAREPGSRCRAALDVDVEGVVAINPQLYWQPGDPVEANIATETQVRRLLRDPPSQAARLRRGVVVARCARCPPPGRQVVGCTGATARRPSWRCLPKATTVCSTSRTGPPGPGDGPEDVERFDVTTVAGIDHPMHRHWERASMVGRDCGVARHVIPPATTVSEEDGRSHSFSAERAR